jgi:hypothetical protein
MDTTVNGEPVPETSGSTGVRWEDTPNRHAYCDSEIRRLRARNRDLEGWHKRDALAVQAHRARADHQEQRARDAEEKLASFADQAAQYQGLT